MGKSPGSSGPTASPPVSLVTAFWESLATCQWSLKGAKGAPHKTFQSRCTPLSVRSFDGLEESQPLEDVSLKVRFQAPTHHWQEVLKKVEIQELKIKHHDTRLEAKGTLRVEMGGWINGTLSLKGKKILSGVAKWLPEGLLSPTAHLILQVLRPLLEAPQMESLSQTIEVHFRERKIFINDLQICPQRPLKLSDKETF